MSYKLQLTIPASTGVCSYPVRSVDGSCAKTAKHLTVESYTVVMLLSYLLLYVPIKDDTVAEN